MINKWKIAARATKNKLTKTKFPSTTQTVNANATIAPKLNIRPYKEDPSYADKQNEEEDHKQKKIKS